MPSLSDFIAIKEKIMPPLIITAFTMAHEIHDTQKRKASIAPNVPYMAHLMSVAAELMAAGFDDEVVAAGLLHDTIEDQGKRWRDPIKEICGERVLALVDACTEKGTGKGPKAPWKERKVASLQKLQNDSFEVLAIKIADRLANVRDLYHARLIQSNTLFDAFNASPDELEWFHREFYHSAYNRLHQIGRKMVHAGRHDARWIATDAMLSEYSRCVSQVFGD